jgi:hypothetical protein
MSSADGLDKGSSRGSCDKAINDAEAETVGCDNDKREDGPLAT